MATYLSVPLKKTYEVDMAKPLREFIANTYGNTKPEDYEGAVQEMNKLRNKVLSKSSDKHESGLEVLYRYYDQLEVISTKLPIAENGIRINFKWQDCFGKETFFSGKRNLTVASASYEKASIMFNIAALQSQIAESQNHSSDEGLKLSAKLFMQSGGMLARLKDTVLSLVQGDPTPDLHPDTLGALSVLMVAQAQDCFCWKAINDKMKPGVTAKLCSQAGAMYSDASKVLNLDTLKGLWPREWLPTVVCKELGFHALADYHQGLHHKDAKEFGQQISRLRRAKDLMTKSETKGGLAFTFGQYQKAVIRDLEEAEKDNNFIYHAKIPDCNTLPPVGKQPIAKATPPSPSLSSNFKDIFEKVVPLAVHQALMSFENRKAEIMNWEIGRMREATQTINGVLASLNLPAAIEDLSGTQVPPSLLEKATKVREMGGVSYLRKLMADLPELLKRNKEILDETMSALAEEGQSDEQLRTQFKERWTRTPSSKLTATIYEEGRKYQQILDNAVHADKVVQERYNKNLTCLELLSKPEPDMVKALPSGTGSAALQGSPVIEKLASLMQQVEVLKNERDAIELEIKEPKFDMSSKFLQALKDDGALDEAGLSQEELDRVYQPLRKQVNDSLQRQEQVLAQIQEANDKFCAAKHGQGGAAARDQMLKDMQSAYDSFVELKGNLEEGTKFYNDLTNLLVKFQSKVSDFCFARKTEKDELLKDLTTSISRQSSAPPPPVPSYQQPGATAEGPRPNAPPPPYPVGGAPHPGAMPMPYPAYPPAPMPQGFNPYATQQYGYPPQMPYAQPPQGPYGQPPQGPYGQPPNMGRPGGYPQWR